MSEHGYFFREPVTLYAVILFSLPMFFFWFILGNSRVTEYVHYAMSAIIEIFHVLSDLFPSSRLLFKPARRSFESHLPDFGRFFSFSG